MCISFGKNVLQVPAETLHCIWQTPAQTEGQLLNASHLASCPGDSGQSIAQYPDILADLLLVRRMKPRIPSLSKGLVRSPRARVRDDGILHVLLAVSGQEQRRAIVGLDREGFLIENIISTAPPDAAAWFYRTSAGADSGRSVRRDPHTQIFINDWSHA